MANFEIIYQDNEMMFTDGAFAETTAESQLAKLQDELDELNSSYYQLTNRAHALIECADLQVVLVGLVVKMGFSMEDFLAAFQAKTERNMKRAWVRQPNGTLQHVAEGG